MFNHRYFQTLWYEKYLRRIRLETFGILKILPKILCEYNPQHVFV